MLSKIAHDFMRYFAHKRLSLLVKISIIKTNYIP